MKKILAVDNNRHILRIITEILEKEGHQVVTAEDGLNALDILKKYMPDVIFVDLVMPNIDGKMLCKIIRDMPKLKDVYIVILSATTAEELIDIAQLGANALIAKGPIKEMAQHIRYVLDKPDLASSQCLSGEILGIKNVNPRVITEELLSIKRHFEIVLERMSEGILEINSEGRIISINSFALSLLNKPEKKLLGSYFIDLFSKDDRQRVRGLMKIKNGKPKRITEDASIDLNGNQIILNILPLSNEDESTSIIILSDVSERKHMQKALQKTYAELEQRVKERTTELVEANEQLKWEIEDRKQAEGRYRLLADNLTDVIWTMDMNMKFTYFSPSVERLIGYSVKEAMARSIEDSMTSASFDKVINVFNQELELHNKGQRDPDRSVSLELEVTCKDGSTVWVEVQTNFLYDLDGQDTGVIGVIRNITDRKNAEEALQQSEEQYRLLVDNANDGIFIAQDEVIKFSNPKAEEIIGYSAEELVKIPFVNLIHPEDRDMVLSRHKNRLKGEELPSTYSFRIINKAGEELWVELNVVLIDWEKRPATLNFLRDITEKRKLEAQFRQAQKMEAVGTLTGGIAHDFNNLLHGIMGFTEILSEGKDRSDPDYEVLQVVEQSTQKAADLVRRLLIFSRKVESEFKPMDLNQQIIRIFKLLERTIPKMISIEHNLDQDLKIISADPLQLEQVLMNLGINGKDAMPDGGRLIFETENITLDEQYCKIHIGANPGKYVLLSVSDTGHGMDKETLEHIFEPFYTTKETGRGTGLGLSMVYGIVKSHGGYIMCYSEPGMGTTFKIYFPVLITESPEQRAEESRVEALPGGREMILMVDDDAIILEVGKAMLERHGYTTIMAESGERAIEIYEKEKEGIDLVILDMGMPGMGGHKCLEHLLKIDPGIKFIIATGYALKGKVKETLESCTAGYIKKPFLRADILKKIREVLDKK